jgi:hypothetical protein
MPLRPDDADVTLDLQALVEQCYRNGGFQGTLNYVVDPDPPLFGVDREWAEAGCKRWGRGHERSRGGGKGKSR